MKIIHKINKIINEILESVFSEENLYLILLIVIFLSCLKSYSLYL